MELYQIIVSSSYKSVYDYISDQDSLAFGYINDPEKFLDVVNKEGVSNRKSIESKYLSKEEKKLIGKGTKELKLKSGTQLTIEPEKVNKQGLLTEGVEVVSYDVPSFKARALADLEADVLYTPVKKFTGNHGENVTIKYPGATVWVWCRSLISKHNPDGEIFNITPFLTSKLSTDVNKTGGSFSFSLPPLTCTRENDTWIVKKGSLSFSKKNEGLLSTNSLYDTSGKEYRNIFLFHTILSPQDLVFIRFETLEREKDQRLEDNSKLMINKSSLPNRIYDMIGLIDNNGIAVQGTGANVAIKVSGRDLSKAFIEDGAYAYPFELSQGVLGGPGSSAQEAIVQRLFDNNSILAMNLYFNNSIEKVFKFVINQLSNIKIVPDNLFEYYVDENGKDRRNYNYNGKLIDKNSSPGLPTVSQYKKAAVNSILDLRNENDRTLFTKEEETIKVNEVYSKFYSFLKEMRKQKARVVKIDRTFGWESFVWEGEKVKQDTFPNYFNINVFNVSQTKVVEENIVSNIDKILDIEESENTHGLPPNANLAKGIWQIVKLALDSNISKRRIVDSSLSTSQGSLINFFRKVCQEPFVELIMDTYGDMYYLTVRKPPTDREGVLTLLEAKVNVETESGVESAIAGIIDVEACNTIDESLSFDDNEAYSWYRFEPQANLLGGNVASLAYLPAVFLPEYAEIWGSRPLQLQHNYLPTLTDESDKKSLDIVQRQAVEDFRYIIQSHAHLPFTRKGSIKTLMDRRYKVGNFIRYKPTGEIFLIDHVQHEMSINEDEVSSISTIMVSRGMVEQLIYGIPTRSREGKHKYISYFNIVETTPTYNYETQTIYREEKVKVGEELIKVDQPTPLIESPSLLSSIGLFSQLMTKNQNMNYLLDYSPFMQNKLLQFINEINKLGMTVIIVPGGGVRTYDQQLALYNKRDSTHPAAHPDSKHGHVAGNAIDINVVGNGRTLKKFTPKVQWIQSGVVDIAHRIGLKWGGDFGDNNHFQYNNLNSDQYRKEPIYEIKKIPETVKSLNIEKLLNKFKVNKEVFEFFLKREQFDAQYSEVKEKGVYIEDGSKELPEIKIKIEKK